MKRSAVRPPRRNVDDPDPTEPISPEIGYPRPVYPVCGGPLEGKRV